MYFLVITMSSGIQHKIKDENDVAKCTGKIAGAIKSGINYSYFQLLDGRDLCLNLNNIESVEEMGFIKDDEDDE